ncbi:MAG: sensor histidine kinase [Bacteroidota bacterium]
MLKGYNIKTGIIFSASIAALATVPRFIRLDFDNINIGIGSFAFLFINLFGNWLIHHFILQKSRTKKSVITASIAIATGLVFTLTFTYLYKLIAILPLGILFSREMNTQQLTGIYFFRSLLISAFTFFVVYYFKMLFALQQSKLENEYLKQESLKAELASLRQQISPHFLFNSLSNLSSLSTDTNVKQYIIKLSDVYRYVLQFQEQNEVLLEQELAFINSYIYILQSRFEEGISFTITISEQARSSKILPLAIQLLVENAVKHNVLSYTKPLQVSIYDIDDYIAVENNYRPKETLEKGSGIGLNNLCQRYRLFAGKEVIIEHTPDLFKVLVPLL